MNDQEPKQVVQEVVREQPKEFVPASIEEVLKSDEDRIKNSLDLLIDRKVNERLLERENRIKEAELIIQQAERRKRLNEELENKLGYDNYRFRVEKLENKFKYLIDVFNRRVEGGHYEQCAFYKPDGSKQNSKNDYFREFAYAARTFGPEKMLSYWKKNEIGIVESKYNDIVPFKKENKYF